MARHNYTNVFKKSGATAPFTPSSGSSALARFRGKPAGNSGVPFHSGTTVSYKPTQRDSIAMPILKNRAKEELLVKHIVDRLNLSNNERRQRVGRMTDIDVQLSGYVSLDADDRKRMRENKQGKPAKPVKHNLPLTASQLDEGVTFLMGVYAPDMDIFTAQSSADKQEIADGLTSEINAQGQRVGYYRQMCKVCVNALRYNIAAMSCSWEQQYGVVFTNSGAGQLTKTNGVVWQGNILKSMDMYNFFYDTSVHPVDLPQKGEYFAEVDRITAFRARKMENDRMLYGCDRFINVDGVPQCPNAAAKYYEYAPVVRDDVQGTRSGGVNWQAQFNDVGLGGAQESEVAIELVNFTAWINPKQFGLADDDELQLWRITMAQSSYICYALKLDDSHGLLPIGVTTPIEDDLDNDQRTYAEMLMPLQHLASFMLNTFQDATRRNVYGLTLFDPRVVALLDKTTEEMVAGVIPIKSTATEVDIDKAFRHYNTASGTEQNVSMVGNIMDLMQKIMPTDQLRQVADLERATLYQAAATVQASSRKNLKIARLMNDQCFTNLKMLMLYGIYANIGSIDYFNEETGQKSQIAPVDLIDAKLELDVGTGLKGIDRLMELQIWQYITNAVIQSQQGIQEIDIVKLLTYVANLAGDRTDLSQFRRTAPAPGTAPAGTPGAPSPTPVSTTPPAPQAPQTP